MNWMRKLLDRPKPAPTPENEKREYERKAQEIKARLEALIAETQAARREGR